VISLKKYKERERLPSYFKESLKTFQVFKLSLKYEKLAGSEAAVRALKTFKVLLSLWNLTKSWRASKDFSSL